MYVVDLQSLALEARMCFAMVATDGVPTVVIVLAYPVKVLVMYVIIMLYFGCGGKVEHCLRFVYN